MTAQSDELCDVPNYHWTKLSFGFPGTQYQLQLLQIRYHYTHWTSPYILLA